MKIKGFRANSPTKFWGITDWDLWWKHVIPQPRYDDISCDSEEVRIDTYKIRVDDEGDD